MKICSVVASRYQGGASINAFDIAMGMVNKGHDVIVVSSDKMSDSYNLGGCKVEIIGQKIRSPLFHYFNPFLLWKLNKILKHTNPDIIHIHTLNLQTFSLCALLYSRRYPMIWTQHDLWPVCMTGWPDPPDCGQVQDQCQACGSWPNWMVKTNRLLKETIFKWSKLGIVCPTGWIANLLRQSRLGAMPTHIIPNGIDTNLFHPDGVDNPHVQKGPSHPERTLLFSGGRRLAGQLPAERKGWNYLAAALQQVAEDFNHIRLLFVGDPIQLPPHFPVKVKFEIQSDRADMKTHYHAADIFVLPTLADNSPLTVLEAMACKVPVISTRVGGIPEMVVSGETGILCPPRDENALADAIRWMLKNPELSRQMADKAYERFLNNYTLEKMIDRYYAVYLKTIRRFNKIIQDEA